MKAFKIQISGTLSSGIQNAIMNPLIRTGLSHGLDKILEEGRESIAESKKNLLHEPTTHNLADAFQNISKKKSR